MSKLILCIGVIVVVLCSVLFWPWSTPSERSKSVTDSRGSEPPTISFSKTSTKPRDTTEPPKVDLTVNVNQFMQGNASNSSTAPSPLIAAKPDLWDTIVMGGVFTTILLLIKLLTRK